MEGDTPSFLHVMPNGLNDPDDPFRLPAYRRVTFSVNF